MPKSTFVAYLLWLIGGWFGVHHFYLGRDRQAFVWWCTWGGFCLGWIRDLWRIPHYVQAANEAYEYMDWLTSQLRKNQKPQFSTARWTGQLCFGTFCGYLVLFAIPESLSPNLITILQYIVVPLGSATGVYIVGNIGYETGSFKWTLFGAYGALIILREPTAIAMVTISSSLLFQWTKKYKRKVEQKGFCRRLIKLTFAGVIIICLWSSFLYYNASVVTSDGETVYVREAVHHFLESTFYKELKATLYELIHIGWQMGWRGMYEAFVEAVDPLGESNALKALNLTKGVEREEISRRCRKLSRDWHPDKHKKEKDKAQEMFIKIQDACKILLDIHKKREP
ncbi:dnaJ homolog subfamily C member 22-like [Anneissia japonica]|uniref:dnaJ homolog subfamily C member 22-like n=1 Tax=Anneissia japonica TaxID=1529436 RepID=UPI00142559DB|nr:dnaJ homolog subfamily C member 22-like [Anneissia japonica]